MYSFSAAAVVDYSLRYRQHRGWDLHPYPPVSRRRRDQRLQRLHHRLRGERDHPEQGDLLAVLVVLLQLVAAYGLNHQFLRLRTAEFQPGGVAAQVQSPLAAQVQSPSPRRESGKKKTTPPKTSYQRSERRRKPPEGLENPKPF